MSTISEKISKFKETCSQMAINESNVLTNTINEEIEKNIKEEVLEYEKEKKKEHIKKIERLEQKHNSEIFQTENNARYEVLKKEDELKERLYNKVLNKIVEFTKGNEYKEYLKKNIEQTINSLNVEENDRINIKITNKDMNLFGKDLSSKYNIQFETIEDSYIGGSIGINSDKQILIDNTLKTQIEDSLN